MSVRLISEGLVVGVRLGSDDSLVISLFDRKDEDSILVVNDITPWQYADAVLGAAREIRRLVVQLAPKQRKNLRLEAFAREIQSLASMGNWRQLRTSSTNASVAACSGASARNRWSSLSRDNGVCLTTNSGPGIGRLEISMI